MRATNTSGVTGLGVVARSGGLYVRVSWCIKGNIGRTEFSVNKHGKVGATRLAMAARAMHTKSPYQVSAAGVWKKISAGVSS